MTVQPIKSRALRILIVFIVSPYYVFCMAKALATALWKEVIRG